MKKKYPKWLGASSAVFAILLLAVSSYALSRPLMGSNRAITVFSEKTAAYAGFSPIVIDGRTKLPIENAVIVIPETGESFVTDANGKTPEIRIPYTAEPSELLEKDWCEITLLTYAEGYAPYALFYLQLTEGSLRQGPTIMLFPDSGKPFSIIEGPPDAWVKELTERYRP